MVAEENGDGFILTGKTMLSLWYCRVNGFTAACYLWPEGEKWDQAKTSPIELNTLPR
jgi:hypothetical protein